jgi:hypothetical protein
MRIRAFPQTMAVVGSLAICVLGIYWRVTSISLANLPFLQAETYKDREAYRVDPYIRAAKHLQALGQTAACAKLLALSDTRDVDHADQIAILCRMLFAQRHGSDFRRPMLGGASFIGGTAYSDWPLEPIEIIDGVPFAIVGGYSILGAPPESQAYIRYCMTNCDWSGIKFEPKTEQQKKDALAKLIASPKWRRQIEQRDRDFFTAQIQ